MMTNERWSGALLTAVRALAGLDDGAFDTVTPEAMRAVMARRGWKFDGAVFGPGHPTHEGEPDAERHIFSDGVTSAYVPVRQTDMHRFMVKRWAEIVAGTPGTMLAPAEVLAEALSAAGPRGDASAAKEPAGCGQGTWLDGALLAVYRAAQALDRRAAGAPSSPEGACASARADGLREAVRIVLGARDEAASDGPAPPADPFLAAARSADGTPWPLTDSLERLVKAADHLLDDHNCDEEGNEEVRHAAESGRRIAAALRAALEGGARG